MSIKELASLASQYPTIMSLEQETHLIREIEKLELREIKENVATFSDLIDRIHESHISNGIFEVDKSNENVFLGFARWLRSIEGVVGIPLASIADDIGLSADDIARLMPGKK
ncbi:hypothetical protein KXR53_29505 [Inquilinus limosus]|uniref:hypothetical protein n=1 Tax=Inquilinus limosus TaxID=171674 RepID=UPI003F15020D